MSSASEPHLILYYYCYQHEAGTTVVLHHPSQHTGLCNRLAYHPAELREQSLIT